MKWDEVPDGVSFAMNKKTAMSLRGDRRGPFFSGVVCGALLIIGLQSCSGDDSPDKPVTTPTTHHTPTAHH